ncbi:MAG: GspH/FimT family pseudopilin [Nitrospinota bacterium]|nr:GspH/FimT family pseudopilin [Nitrospinota bacterium]
MKSNKPGKFPDHGFTLIEMMAVLVLMGLFAALTAPFAMKTLDRIQSDASARKIFSMLAQARSQAVAKKTPLLFQGNLDKNQYWVFDPTSDNSVETVQLDRSLQFREFFNGEESVSEGIFSVIFYPLGNTSGGTIFLEPADTGTGAPSFALTIDPVTGKPYLQHAS